MDSLSHLQYMNGADECYKVHRPFDSAVILLEICAEEENIKINEKYVLVIEIPDGVYVRCQIPEVCIFFDEFAEFEYDESDNDKLEIEKLDSADDFTDLTKRHKAPINSFGNERLAIWRTGFV